MRILSLSLAIFATAAVAADATAAAAQQFTVDHAIDMPSVGSPSLSPDGTRLLFTRSELDWEDNERDSRLWIANFDGSDARPFTSSEGDGSAAWSPDGRWVAFARSAKEAEEAGRGGEGRQIWLIRADGGEATQLTKHPTSVRSFEWTEDSRRIVFSANDTLSKEEKERRKDGYDAVFVNEGPNGQDRDSYSNLWYVEVGPEDAESMPITTGDHLLGGFAVSPEGGRVAFTFRTENHRNDGHLSEIAVVDIPAAGAGPVSRDGFRVLTRNEAPEGGLVWSPDGRRLLFGAPSLETWELDQGNLYLMDLATGDVTQLAPESTLNIGSVAFTPDGRYLDFTALDRTTSNFYRLDTRNGRITAMSGWEGTAGSASWSRDHSRVAFTFDSPTSPAEVYTARYDDGMQRTAITDVHAEIRSLALAQPELVRWRSTDGLEIEGILYQPAGGRAAPGSFVLEIHGGPAGVFTRGFDSEAQILAAQGYAVLQPNVRGSTGYGDALLRGNMRDIGGGDYHDLMTGVDLMIERGIAHPDSLAVKGWSYGGILGGWTITQTDRFRAASLGAMVSDWPSEFGVGFNFDVSRWYIGGDPWSNAEEWRMRSAYVHADQVSTPTILFHGDNDNTDTMGQSMNFHAALRHHGVPTRFLRFPREGHGIREPRHRRTRLIEEIRWFEHYVRGNPDWVAPERVSEESESAVAEESAGGG